MNNATNNAILNAQQAAIEKYMAEFEMKEVFVHELFGFDTPLKGFEDPIPVPATPHPLTPAIDAGYVFNKGMVRRFLLSMMNRESVMLVGDKGTGKSSFIQQMMARLNLPLLAINGGPALDEVDLLGCKTIKGGDVAYVDGVLSYAFRWGVPVLIDEICTLKQGVLVAMNDIIQGDPMITLKHHGIDPTLDPKELMNLEGGMTIVRHPAFRLSRPTTLAAKLPRTVASRGSTPRTRQFAVASPRSRLSS